MIDNQLFTNSFSSLFMVVRVALNTTLESIIPNGSYSIGDAHGFQACTVFKCLVIIAVTL